MYGYFLFSRTTQIFFLLFLITVGECTVEIVVKKGTKKEDVKFLWGLMKDALLNLRSFSRPIFMTKCFESKYLCSTTIIRNTQGSLLQWNGNPNKYEKAHFWQTYKCVKKQKHDLCPVDGKWGAWTKWTRCSAKKYGEKGVISRTRLCNNPVPALNGLKCHGSKVQTISCRKRFLSRKYTRAHAEARDYMKKIHLAYPSLVHNCIENFCTYSQVGEILEPTERNKYWSSLHCVKFYRACPVDGGWSMWSYWSRCHPECGEGKRYRYKKCNKPVPKNGGLPCEGKFYEEGPCFGRKCTKEDFLYGNYASGWSPFGPCSQTCGKYGEQERKRICLRPGKCAKEFGNKKDEISMTRPCYNGPCPRKGGWSEWSAYTTCSADCGSGRKIRLRLCSNPDPVGSASCFGYAVDTKSCNGTCKIDLNKGKKKGNESIIKPRKKGYIKISKLQDRVPSGDPFSYALDPNSEKDYTSWSWWSKCSKTCDVGYRKRIRNCKLKTRVCLGEIKQTQYCNVQKCPVNGGWSEWLSWGPCTTTCGNGTQIRYRKCDNPLPTYGGSCFGATKETKHCKVAKCAAINLGFGKWGEWSSCTKTCGLGDRVRARSCDVKSMDPAVKKMFKGLSTSQICTKKRTNDNGVCNQNPCPVDGSWSIWNAWSSCSQSCGTGYHYRSRSCSDPAPIYGGKLCPGPGSETTQCFKGPCPDFRNKVVYFNGKSWLKYEARHRPTRFLVLYVSVFPENSTGVLLHRKRSCKTCKHYVKLYLDKGQSALSISIGKSKMNIKANATLTLNKLLLAISQGHQEQARAIKNKVSSISNNTNITPTNSKIPDIGRVMNPTVQVDVQRFVEMKRWHTILAVVGGNDGFIRLDDGTHYFGQYSPPLGETNYDTAMVVGIDKNGKDGFKGMMGNLRVNFKELSLSKIPGWRGYGTPFDKLNTSIKYSDPVLGYPAFRGSSFMKLELKNNLELSTSISFRLEHLNGVLLFNMGYTPASYFFVDFVNGQLRFCFQCTKAKRVCQKIQILQVYQWYVISIYISKNMAHLRLNRGKAFKITSPGVFYRPRSPLFIGGGERQDTVLFSKLMGNKKGFGGVIDNIVINGETYKLRDKAIMDLNGFISSMGLSYVPKVTQVYEQTDSIVTLRCDYSYYNTNHEINVAWFRGDVHIKSGSDQKIKPHLPGIHNISALVLSPSQHQEGIYTCAINQGGALTVAHAFVLIRQNLDVGTPSMVYTEVLYLRLFLLIAPLVLAVCLVTVSYQALKRQKKKTITDIAAKYSAVVVSELETKLEQKDKLKDKEDKEPERKEIDEKSESGSESERSVEEVAEKVKDKLSDVEEQFEDEIQEEQPAIEGFEESIKEEMQELDLTEEFVSKAESTRSRRSMTRPSASRKSQVVRSMDMVPKSSFDDRQEELIRSSVLGTDRSHPAVLSTTSMYPSRTAASVISQQRSVSERPVHVSSILSHPAVLSEASVSPSRMVPSVISQQRSLSQRPPQVSSAKSADVSRETIRSVTSVLPSPTVRSAVSQRKSTVQGSLQISSAKSADVSRETIRSVTSVIPSRTVPSAVSQQKSMVQRSPQTSNVMSADASSERIRSFASISPPRTVPSAVSQQKSIVQRTPQTSVVMAATPSHETIGSMKSVSPPRTVPSAISQQRSISERSPQTSVVMAATPSQETIGSMKSVSPPRTVPSAISQQRSISERSPQTSVVMAATPSHETIGSMKSVSPPRTVPSAISQQRSISERSPQTSYVMAADSSHPSILTMKSISPSRTVPSAISQQMPMSDGSTLMSKDLPQPPSSWTSNQQINQSIILESQMSMSPLPAGSPSPPRNLPSLDSMKSKGIVEGHKSSTKSSSGRDSGSISSTEGKQSMVLDQIDLTVTHAEPSKMSVISLNSFEETTPISSKAGSAKSFQGSEISTTGIGTALSFNEKKQSKIRSEDTLMTHISEAGEDETTSRGMTESLQSVRSVRDHPSKQMSGVPHTVASTSSPSSLQPIAEIRGSRHSIGSIDAVHPSAISKRDSYQEKPKQFASVQRMSSIHAPYQSSSRVPESLQSMRPPSPGSIADLQVGSRYSVVNGSHSRVSESIPTVKKSSVTRQVTSAVSVPSNTLPAETSLTRQRSTNIEEQRSPISFSEHSESQQQISNVSVNVMNQSNLNTLESFHSHSLPKSPGSTSTLDQVHQDNVLKETSSAVSGSHIRMSYESVPSRVSHRSVMPQTVSVRSVSSKNVPLQSSMTREKSTVLQKPSAPDSRVESPEKSSSQESVDSSDSSTKSSVY